MLGHGSCKLFKISESKKEFEKLCRTLTGENKKADISPELINKSLMEEVNSQLSSDQEVYLIHDPSDIRKPYSKALGGLGKVRDLKGNIMVVSQLNVKLKTFSKHHNSRQNYPASP